MPEFVHARNHRVHDANVTQGRGPKNGSKLGLENIGILKAEPDGTASQEGVFLFLKPKALGELVTSDIESADDDGMRFCALGDEAVVLKLLLLIGRLLAVEI